MFTVRLSRKQLSLITTPFANSMPFTGVNDCPEYFDANDDIKGVCARYAEEKKACAELSGYQEQFTCNQLKPNVTIPIFSEGLDLVMFTCVLGCAGNDTKVRTVNEACSSLSGLSIHGDALVVRQSVYGLDDLTVPDLKLLIQASIKRRRSCSYCKRVPQEQEPCKRCSACKHSRYCSRKCQRKAWKTHKQECVPSQ